MPDVDVAQLMGYMVTFITGGGIFEVIRQVREERARRVAARKSSAEVDLSIEKHQDDRQQRFIDNLVADNERLRIARNAALEERDAALQRLREVEAELIEVKDKVEALQAQIHDLLGKAEGSTS